MDKMANQHVLRDPLYLDRLSRETNYLGEPLGTFTVVLSSAGSRTDDPVPEHRPATVHLKGIPEDEIERYFALDSAALDLQLFASAAQ